LTSYFRYYFILQRSKGGNTISSFGEGGGGGGGLITTNNTPLPANGSFTVEGGMGNTGPGITGQPGQAGDTISDFNPVLNGFLFNSVRSLITGHRLIQYVLIHHSRDYRHNTYRRKTTLFIFVGIQYNI
jgi:hypothetical protein